MKPARPTLEEYRSLTAEERELVRLDQARGYAAGKLKPTVVKQRKLKNADVQGGKRSAVTRAQLVAAIAEGAELNTAQDDRALEVLARLVTTVTGEVEVLTALGRYEAGSAQRQNVDALVDADSAAATLLKQQIATLEEVKAEAHKHFVATKARLGEGEAPAEAAEAAFLEWLTAQIKESLADLRSVAGDASGSASPR